MKYHKKTELKNVPGSHPVRGAWIEIAGYHNHISGRWSHPVRGAWIEIGRASPRICQVQSHPVRGAWIEILNF